MFFCCSINVFSDTNTLPTGDELANSSSISSLYIYTQGYSSSSSSSSSTWSSTVTPTYDSNGAHFNGFVFSTWGDGGLVYKPVTTTFTWNFHSNSLPGGNTKYFQTKYKIATTSVSSPVYVNYQTIKGANIPYSIKVNGNVVTSNVKQDNDYLVFTFSSDLNISSITFNLGRSPISSSIFSPMIWNNNLNYVNCSIRELSFSEYQTEVLTSEVVDFHSDVTFDLNQLLSDFSNKVDSDNDYQDGVLGWLENLSDGISETIDSILDLPNTLGSMLRSLFIPNDDFFDNYLNNISDMLSDKFGFIAQTFDFISSFFDSIFDTSELTYHYTWDFKYFDNGSIVSVNMFDLSDSDVFIGYGGLANSVRRYTIFISQIIITFLNVSFGFVMFKKIFNPSVDTE